MTFRITYSVLSADMSELHKEFDKVLEKVRSNLGQEFPSWIGGKAFTSGRFVESHNPANTGQLLGKFHKVPVTELDRVMEIAHKAQKSWGHTPWQERVKVLRKAAELISERRLEISVIMGLETGKNRLEALGDTEESADLIRYYAQQLEDAKGYDRPLAALSPNESTRSVLKPYGVFAVIAPFNFPMALATGMAAGALLGGNTVVLKPSQETPWTGEKLYEALRDAGLPEGVFQLVHGTGSEIGAAMLRHPRTDGIVFTGSKRVGMELLHNFSREFPKPCFLELGGKNPAIICEKADLDKAAEGAMRSAFGLSGQKCSALSRLYVHKNVKDNFLKLLLEKSRAIKIGDPLDKDVYMGPVINKTAHERYLQAVDDARKDCRILLGGEDLRKAPEFSNGWFVAPTIVEAPHSSRLVREELFLPFLTVETFSTLEEALKLANDCDYGLTAGIFSEDKTEVEYFMDNIEAGVLYSNRRTGATTGAWPGVNSFCGWKGSGSTGKGGCGPYYVSQFMREQSQTRMS
jgi:1-pyrroline-5-carboxylate dehydrogenase